MLIISLVSTIVFLAIVPFFSPTVSSVHYTRVSVMVFLLCLFIGTFLSVESVDLYHSLFNYSPFSIVIDSLLYLIAALVLVSFSPISISVATKKAYNAIHVNTEPTANIKPEYSLILMFSVLGASMIISANDLISIYVALELQSFGLYLLACLRTEETGSTHASLKYFLLGAISSAFILLGISIVYQEIGSTQFQNIGSFILAGISEADITSEYVNFNHWNNNVIIFGILSMLCGFIFKISAAPFHSWFADVIQGVPTYTSMIIINLPKISIFTFLFNLFITIQQGYTSLPGPEMFIMITTLFSLVLGTVAGLMQTKLKRLLAFSTISHVGFILIGLTVQSEVSLNAIIFYLVQYTLTIVLTFIVLVAYENTYSGYASKESNDAQPWQINYIADIQGTGQSYKLLSFTFVLCLFSIAGIPPITGFYAKLGVLNSSILQNINIVFITAIICSIISAAYYLKIIKVVMFDGTIGSGSQNNTHKDKTTWDKLHQNGVTISPVHSYSIAMITAFLCLFILDPKLILNCTELVALSTYLL